MTNGRGSPILLLREKSKTMETRAGHDIGEECGCVSNHNPNPMELNRHHVVPQYAGGSNDPSNLVWICPTTHANVHELLRAWEEAGGEPNWDIRKHFSVYARHLAQRGYEERE